MSKEAKAGSSIEGTKHPSVLTPNPSVLTPPPYKNNQNSKGGRNDKTHDSHTRETSFSRSDDDSLARNLDTENENIEDDEYNEFSEVKGKVDSEVAVNTDLVMLCFTTIPSTSNILKNLLINSNYHPSY